MPAEVRRRLGLAQGHLRFVPEPRGYSTTVKTLGCTGITALLVPVPVYEPAHDHVSRLTVPNFDLSRSWTTVFVGGVGGGCPPQVSKNGGDLRSIIKHNRET